MYDNVKMLIDVKMSSEEIEHFCKKHNLKTADGKKHANGNERNLQQAKGIYIKLEDRPPKAARITIECSLHKLYNEITSGKRQNWNDFNFKQAKQAAEELQNHIGFDLQQAKVTKYEIGINLQATHPAEKYMKQLICFVVKEREIRILEEPRQKEYKQYSTNRSREKRIVYVFYDKTHEAQSKATSDHKNEVPPNIIRIEMKVKRIKGVLNFETLFEDTFQKNLFQDFATKLKECIRYKSKPKKGSGLTKNQFEIYKALKRIGEKKTIRETEKDYKENKLTQRQYYYKLHIIKELAKTNEDLEAFEEEIEEFKTLIHNKLQELQKITNV